jgi:hypothetical protein
MADQYSGQNMDLYFNTVDIGATLRSVEISQAAPEPEEIDVTHKGDTERQTLEGFPGAVATTLTANFLDEEGDVTGLVDFAINSQDTLFFYPQGMTHTLPMLTIQAARLISIDETTPYDGGAEKTGTFNAKNSLTRSTYSSA